MISVKHVRAANLLATCAWAGMIPLAYFFGWLASVVFVSVISVYANFASHLAAWRADVPPDPSPILLRIEAKLDKMTRDVNP